jgi:hypothetical protein
LAKAGNTMIRLSRKGVMIWIGLMLFIAGWMFVLGILVGRGMAPVNLDAGKLEQELAALKARMLRQEQAQVDARASGQNGGPSDLGFYEALKDPKAEKPFAPLPKPKPVKTPSAAAKWRPWLPHRFRRPSRSRSPNPNPSRSRWSNRNLHRNLHQSRQRLPGRSRRAVNLRFRWRP